MRKEVEEFAVLWENGSRNSLNFCRYMKKDFENLTWECVENDEDIPQDLEDLMNWLEDDIFQHWKTAKIKAGETNKLGYPKGE